MNREKYINDDMYRMGYLEGRKDGINRSVKTFKLCLDNLKTAIDYFNQNCNRLLEELKEEIQNND